MLCYLCDRGFLFVCCLLCLLQLSSDRQIRKCDRQIDKYRGKLLFVCCNQTITKSVANRQIVTTVYEVEFGRLYLFTGMSYWNFVCGLDIIVPLNQGKIFFTETLLLLSLKCTVLSFRGPWVALRFCRATEKMPSSGRNKRRATAKSLNDFPWKCPTLEIISSQGWH
jgi:hypothetical protein